MLGDVFNVVQQKISDSSSKDVLWSLFAFSALVISWSGYLASTWISRRHERRMRVLRREDRSLDVVFFDVTSRQPGDRVTLRSQPLHSVRLDDTWDAAQKKLIEHWDARSCGSIVCPKNDVDAAALADRIYSLACCTLSTTIPAIRGYLQDDQMADERDGFKHVRFLACLTRPHKSMITWKDTPRLIIVPVNTARHLVSLSESDIVCKHSAENRKTWLQVLRAMGLAWRDHEKPLYYRGIASLDIGFE